MNRTALIHNLYIHPLILTPRPIPTPREKEGMIYPSRNTEGQPEIDNSIEKIQGNGLVPYLLFLLKYSKGYFFGITSFNKSLRIPQAIILSLNATTVLYVCRYWRTVARSGRLLWVHTPTDRRTSVQLSNSYQLMWRYSEHFVRH